MRKSGLFLRAIAVGASPVQVQAQVGRCGWELGKWVCRQEAPNPLGGLSNPADVGNSFNNGFQKGQQMRQRLDDERRLREQFEQQQRFEQERQALELERLRLENDRLRMQIESPGSGPNQPNTASLEETLDVQALLQKGDCYGALRESKKLGDKNLEEIVERFCVSSLNIPKSGNERPTGE